MNRPSTTIHQGKSIKNPSPTTVPHDKSLMNPLPTIRVYKSEELMQDNWSISTEIICMTKHPLLKVRMFMKASEHVSNFVLAPRETRWEKWEVTGTPRLLALAASAFGSASASSIGSFSCLPALNDASPAPAVSQQVVLLSHSGRGSPVASGTGRLVLDKSDSDHWSSMPYCYDKCIMNPRILNITTNY